LKSHAATLLEAVPEAVRAGTRINAHNMDTKYSIDFASPGEAGDAARTLRNLDIVWTDRKSGEPEDFPIRITPDRSINGRLVVRTLTSLFEQCQQHMRENNIQHPGRKMGTTGPRGDLFYGDRDDVALLFHVSRNEVGDPEIVPDLDGLQVLQITKTTADAMVVKAIGEARRSAMRR